MIQDILTNGIGLPEVKYSNRKGIILAGGTGSRLFPITHSICKQLVPVYDKPMIYYPLSTLMHAGIRDILVIVNPEDINLFFRLLGDGSQWGLDIFYAEQERTEGLAQAFLIGEQFIDGNPVCLVLGDNLMHCDALPDILHSASERTNGATVFGYEVEAPGQFGVVEIGDDGIAVSLDEKPDAPKSNYAVPGVYFYDNNVVDYARGLRPSSRGELEITDLNRMYLERGELNVELLDDGIAWFDAGLPDSLADASRFVRGVQQREGCKIACPEEIALTQGMIDRGRLDVSLAKYQGTPYGDYLKTL
jgi:glucose-1-phosphate thymidylyltransferase